MTNTLESAINQIVARASSEIAQAVRANIAAEVERVIAHGAAQATPATAKRKPGRPPNVSAAATPAASRKPTNGAAGRRAATFSASDVSAVLAMISAKPGQSPTSYRTASKLSPKAFKNLLKKLKGDGRVKVSGVGKSTRYSVT